MKKEPIDYLMHYVLPVCLGSILGSMSIMFAALAIRLVRDLF